MGFRKTHDLAVRVESYQQNGQTKFKYKTVGLVLTNERGDEMLLIDRTFNPAGALVDGKSGVVLSKFEREDDRQPPPRQAPAAADFDDDIPF